jgi:pimeloyl-ACP methyl ester carboxylesterase
VALLVAAQLTERVSRLVIEDAVPPYPREPRPVPERPDDVLPFDWALLEATYAEMTDAEMRHWPALSAITAPTLVLGGGPSSHVPAERIEQMARLIPQCEVRTIEAGHHIHESAPAEFAAVVASWLATSDPAR